MEIILEIGNTVMLKNGKLGTILSQIGKETKDPKEELWFEVKDEDFKTDHYPLSDFTPDLFEHQDKLPKSVQDIIFKYCEIEADEGLDYVHLAKFVEEVEAEGYSFEYYLDAVPYYLHKIN